jgi:hypothetical protein
MKVIIEDAIGLKGFREIPEMTRENIWPTINIPIIHGESALRRGRKPPIVIPMVGVRSRRFDLVKGEAFDITPHYREHISE